MFRATFSRCQLSSGSIRRSAQRRYPEDDNPPPRGSERAYCSQCREISAPRRLASRRQAMVKRVVPLAAIAITTSWASTSCWLIRLTPSSASSSPLHRSRPSVFLPSRKDHDQPLFRPAKRRCELSTILLGKTTGRAGADIDKSALTLETRMHCDHGGRDLFAGSHNRRDGCNWPSTMDSAISSACQASILE